MGNQMRTLQLDSENTSLYETNFYPKQYQSGLECIPSTSISTRDPELLCLIDEYMHLKMEVNNEEENTNC